MGAENPRNKNHIAVPPNGEATATDVGYARPRRRVSPSSVLSSIRTADHFLSGLHGTSGNGLE